MEKMPPREKVNEAWSALADSRVRLDRENNRAEVDSSDGAKTYIVTWDGDRYTSNDNATYWKLYPGYPIIAVMMMLGLLPYDREMAEKWAGVNWTRLNNDFKRDYAKAVDAVINERGLDSAAVAEAVDNVYRALAALPGEIKRGKLRPPK